MEDKQIKVIEKELKKLGCGRVELGSDFEIKGIEGDLFNTKFVRYSEGEEVGAFVAVAKSPYGAVVLGKDDASKFLKISVQLFRLLFSTFFSKTTLSLVVRTLRILKGKR